MLWMTMLACIAWPRSCACWMEAGTGIGGEDLSGSPAANRRAWARRLDSVVVLCMATLALLSGEAIHSSMVAWAGMTKKHLPCTRIGAGAMSGARPLTEFRLQPRMVAQWR